MILDNWQKEFIEHRGDCLLCTGRQIGKTTSMAIKAAKRMLEKRTNIIIVSLSEDQAKLIISMILRHLEQTNKTQLKKGNKFINQNKVTTKNGSVALARPVGNTGDALRGFTGDVLIIDEASRMPELAFTAAEPTLLSTGGEVWMCSTPFGKKGYFWDQYNAAVGQEDTELENEMGWKVWHVNGEEVIKNRPISDEWTEEKRRKAIKRLENVRKRWSDLRYGQEILAEFMDDLQRFFTEESIIRQSTLKQPETTDIEGKNYMGNDLARMGGDAFTAEIINENEGLYRHILNYSETKLLTTTNERLILEFAKQWSVKKVGIDAGPGTLGVSVFDHLLKTELRNKVLALNFRQIVLDSNGNHKQRILKEDMYDNLRAMLETGELWLLDDDSVRASLRSIQIELRQDQYGTNKVKIWGNDDHIADGLAYAAWIAKKEKTLNLFCTSSGSNKYGI